MEICNLVDGLNLVGKFSDPFWAWANSANFDKLEVLLHHNLELGLKIC